MGRHPRWNFTCSKWCRERHQRCTACGQLCEGEHPQKLYQGLCRTCWEHDHLCRDCQELLPYRSPDRRCVHCRQAKEVVSA